MPVLRSSEDSGQSGSQSGSQRVVVSVIVSTVPHLENNLVDIPRRVQSRKRTKSDVSGGTRVFRPSAARSTPSSNGLRNPSALTQTKLSKTFSQLATFLWLLLA